MATAIAGGAQGMAASRALGCCLCPAPSSGGGLRYGRSGQRCASSRGSSGGTGVVCATRSATSGAANVAIGGLLPLRHGASRRVFRHSLEGRRLVSPSWSKGQGATCSPPRALLGDIPPLSDADIESAVGALASATGALSHLAQRAEGFIYTVADAAVVGADSVVGDAVTTTVAPKNSGWLGGLTTLLEDILKVLETGFTRLHVPYAYGFSIILLTVLVKAATLPLSKKQVESSLAMQNLQPMIKAIQERYKGDQERIQLETARLYKQANVNPLAGCLPTLATFPVWIGLYRALTNVANEGFLTEGFFFIPSLAGPTSIAARASGSGLGWLFPFVDGQPPLGWHDTICYLILPVTLVASQYLSMKIISPPQSDDPAQKQSQVIMKFLPLMIGYFALSVPSGLSLYWLTNNLLTTGQQVWLKKLGGAKPAVGTDGGGILNVGTARRTVATTSSPASKPKATSSDAPELTRGEKFKLLKAKEEEDKRKEREARAASSGNSDDGGSEDDGDDDGVVVPGVAPSAKVTASSPNGAVDSTYSRRSKRSKRRKSGSV